MFPDDQSQRPRRSNRLVECDNQKIQIAAKDFRVSRCNEKPAEANQGAPQFSLPPKRGRVRLKFVKEESERDPVQETSDRQRRERFLKFDEDCGSGASDQGSEADQKQHETRRLIGTVVRSAPWI